MDRIEDLVDYFNSYRMNLEKVSTRESLYVLADWIIYSTQIQQFVKELFRLFGCDDKYKDENSVFRYESLPECTDSLFMQYIRSLAVIHPNNTDRYRTKGLQKSAECSPYFDKFNFHDCFMLTSPHCAGHVKYNNKLYRDDEKYIIRIYSNGSDSDIVDERIAIHPDEIEQFCINHYNQLKVLSSLVAYNKSIL